MGTPSRLWSRHSSHLTLSFVLVECLRFALPNLYRAGVQISWSNRPNGIFVVTAKAKCIITPFRCLEELAQSPIPPSLGGLPYTPWLVPGWIEQRYGPAFFDGSLCTAKIASDET